jgi:hypothetical protein
MNSLLAQLPMPAPVTRWEFWAVIAYLTIQSLVQLYQLRQASQLKVTSETIRKQTNGLIAETVKNAATIAHSEGEQKGRMQEQARMAAKQAVADEVATHLAEIRSHDGE